MQAGGEGGRDMETRNGALQPEVPVQNMVTKMDIVIVSKHCYRDAAAGKRTLGVDGAGRLKNIVIVTW